MSNTRIEPATVEDLPELAELLADLFSKEADFRPDQGKQLRGLKLILEAPNKGRIFVLRHMGKILGMIKALTQGGPQVSVIDIMERDIPAISCRAPLTEAIQLLHRSSKPLIGVLSEDGSVKGIITYENLAEYMLVAEAGANWTWTVYHYHPDFGESVFQSIFSQGTFVSTRLNLGLLADSSKDTR